MNKTSNFESSTPICWVKFAVRDSTLLWISCSASFSKIINFHLTWMGFLRVCKIKISKSLACPIRPLRTLNWQSLCWRLLTNVLNVFERGKWKITCHLRVRCSYICLLKLSKQTPYENNESINAFNMCWKWYRIRGWPPREKAYVRRLFYIFAGDECEKKSKILERSLKMIMVPYSWRRRNKKMWM